MSATESRKRKKTPTTDAEVLEMDKVRDTTKMKKQDKKKPKKSEKIFDEWSREIDADGWLVDPIERLKQGRIGEMYAHKEKSLLLQVEHKYNKLCNNFAKDVFIYIPSVNAYFVAHCCVLL